MTKHTFATFDFEHETVLGDILDLLFCYQGKIESFFPREDVWVLTLSFSAEKELKSFIEDLGRDPN